LRAWRSLARGQSNVDVATALVGDVIADLAATNTAHRADDQRARVDAALVILVEDLDQVANRVGRTPGGVGVQALVAVTGRELGARDQAPGLRRADRVTAGRDHRGAGRERAIVEDRGVDLRLDPHD